MVSNLRKNEFVNELMEAKPKHFIVASNSQKVMVLKVFQNIFLKLCVEKLTSIGRNSESAIAYINSRQGHFNQLFGSLSFFTDKFFQPVKTGTANSDKEFSIDETTYLYLLEEVLTAYTNAEMLFEDFEIVENSGRADAAPALKLASRKLH